MAKMSVIYAERFVCLALAVFFGLATAGCRGRSTEPGGQPGQPGQPQAATSQPASQAGGQEPPEIHVVGNEARVDLGPVAAGSTHVIVFVVDNPTDQPLVFKTVRGDCECISAKDAPDRIAPHGSVRIAATYVAPTPAIKYESALLIMTDNPNRKLIMLRVASSPPR